MFKLVIFSLPNLTKSYVLMASRNPSHDFNVKGGFATYYGRHLVCLILILPSYRWGKKNWRKSLQTQVERAYFQEVKSITASFYQK
jgi:hypothetical protein